ncbi:MAG: alanine racemase [Actinomycetota bacterium]
MTLRLTVKSAPWHDQVAAVATAYGEMIPVVKGNGYGFGATNLMPQACGISPTIAVGSVFEAHTVPATHTAMVLTPSGADLPTSLSSQTILTVGSRHHVDILQHAGWNGPVVVKLGSSTRRYGVANDELEPLLESVSEAGLTQVGWSVHPPLDGTSDDHMTDVATWLSRVDPHHPMYVSHLSPVAVQQLRTNFPRHRVVARVGTALWLGDKTQLKLHTDVLDVHLVRKDMTAGYRKVTITTDGSLVLVGAGSAHGVFTVGDQLSPFHFQRTRLRLLEPSHMHTSMLLVGSGSPCPQVDDLVEVQQPLTRVAVDTIYWT